MNKAPMKHLFRNLRSAGWIPTLLAGVILLAFLIHNDPRPQHTGENRPRAAENFQHSPTPPTVPDSHLAEALTQLLPPAAEHETPPDIGVLTAATPTSTKTPQADESALRRWQLGTHWGREQTPSLSAFSSWAERYLKADQTHREEMLSDGLQLAQLRRPDYLKLIVSDPREALASAIPYSISQQLPAAIAGQLERRVSGKGDFLVAATVPPEGVPGQPQVLRHAMLGQDRFTAHVFGDRKDQRTTHNVSLHGVAIDNQLALSESPLRLLEVGEPLPAAARKTEPLCSVSGLAVGSATATVVPEGALAAASGDQVHWLCRGGHLEAAEFKVRAAEGGVAQDAPATAAYYSTTGNRRILVILVDFSDFPGGPVSQSTAQASINDVTAFIRSNSFNQITFVQKDVTPVLRMSRTGSSYATGDDAFGLLADARTAAANAGYNPANYDFDVVAFASIGFGWGGLGYVGGKGSWVQGSFSRGVTAHELGHNFGNWHANSWVSSTIVGTSGTHNEYANPFDVLGNASSYPHGHHSANFKFLNGWLPNTQLHTVSANGTYRIHGHDFGVNLDPTRKYGIRIPVAITVGGETMDYWLDYRPAFGTTATSNGVLLKWGNNSGTQYASRLLDTQPGTLGNMQDAPLLVGNTFTDSARSLSITALAKGGTGPDSYMDVQIAFNAAPPVTLSDALDLPSVTWTTGGNLPWTGQRIMSHDGVDAAASGAITNTHQTWVETTVTGPGTLTYWWKVSSETNYDFLSFLVDGLAVDSISGESGWLQRTNTIPAGAHTLRWRYSKDGSVASGGDQGWLDQIAFIRTGPPANDMFANRLALLPTSVTAAGNNVSATAETGEPSHAGNTGGKSVWWTWTAPVSGPVSITTAGSSFDTLLGVYTGTSVSALTLIGSNDDSGGGPLTSLLSFTATVGTVYQIAVDGYNGASGDINLTITLPPPANDQFANRFILAGVTATGYNSSATKETGEPAHGGNNGGKSVWWSWTAPASGPVTISTAGSPFDTLLGVYTGTSVSALTLIGSNDDSGGGPLTSLVSFAATVGTVYQIAVDGYNGASGSINLTITLPPPPNDQFASRSLLTGTTATGYNVSATKETGEPAHGGNDGGKSVWWTWTAPVSGPITITTAGSSFDTLLGVYTGTSVSALTLIGGNDDSGGGPLTSLVSFTATAGTVYQIAVDGYNGASGSINLTITIPPPSNDQFASRLSLTWATATGYNVSATKETGEPPHGGNDGGKSVWWSWMAPVSGPVTITTAGSSYDTLLAVYTGTSVSALTPIASNDDSGGGLLTSLVSFTATRGTVYQIAVDGYNAASGSINLSITVPTPPNDLFANRSILAGSTATGYNVSATKETGEPAHGGNVGGNSVWWTWTAPTNGIVSINTSGSSFDTLLGVYTGASVNTLTLIAGNDDSGGTLASAVRFFATAGTRYQIAVDGYNGSSGAIRLNVLQVAPLSMGSAQRLPDGAFRISIGSADGSVVDPTRAGVVSVYATTNLSLPLSSWTRLTGSVTAANGMLWIDDPEARTLPMRFYCVSERP